MKQPDLEKLAGLTESRSREYSRLEEAAYAYGAVERLDRPIELELRRHAKLLKSQPSDFSGMVVGAILLTRIFGSEPARRRFLARGEYRPLEQKAFEGLMLQPWRIALYSVRSRVGEGFFQIEDLGGGEVGLLCSKSMEKLEIKGRPIFLSGLFGDSSCLQTFGPVLDLPAFDATDLDTFARLAAPDTYAAQGLEGVIARDPLPFYLLTHFGRHSIAIGSSGVLRYAASEFRPSNALLEKASTIEPFSTSKGLRRLELSGTDKFDAFKTLVLDPKRKRATLVAASIEAYRDEAATPLLAGEAPPEPDFVATMPMVLAIDAVLEKAFPGLARMAAKEAGSVGGKQRTSPNPELDALNAAMGKYLALTNKEGQRPDAKAIAADFGIDPGTFAGLVGSLEADLERKFHIDLPGGIAGIVELPPSKRQAFAEALVDNPLFTLSASEAIEREVATIDPGFSPYLSEGGRGGLTAKRLPGLLERAAKDFFGPGARVVLGYTLWLMLEMGPRPQAVDDYGCEVLRLFWQLLLPDRTEVDIDVFLHGYRAWVRTVLVPYGITIAPAKSEGDKPPTMVGSDFLFRWLSKR